jgi:phage tail-like protein
MADGKSPTTDRRDPLPTFCFKVDLNIPNASDEPSMAFFKNVQGLSFENEVIDVAAGGVNNTTFRLVGRAKWKNLVFKQGFTKSSAILAWRQEWLGGKMTRANGTIYMLDTALQTQGTWKFFAGWPCKWDLSELDASKSELAIETLEIAHEGLTFS